MEIIRAGIGKTCTGEGYKLQSERKQGVCARLAAPRSIAAQLHSLCGITASQWICRALARDTRKANSYRFSETNMTASEKSILHALENSMFMFPEMPGHWDLPTFPGLRAHATPEVSHLFGNMVGVSTLTQENVDSVIAQVQEFFAKRGHMVGWWLNPSSTPVDLVSRLETAGFSRVIEQAGLVLTDMQRDIRCNPLVTVRKATIADRENLIRLYTVAYPIPEKLAAIYCDLLWRIESANHYLAFLDGVEQPVSVSSMFSPPNSTIAVMQGAATLTEHRGQGIYTAMMAKRLADARAMGKDTAVLQGDRKTSAPICVKLGFKDVCSIDYYVWGNV